MEGETFSYGNYYVDFKLFIMNDDSGRFFGFVLSFCICIYGIGILFEGNLVGIIMAIFGGFAALILIWPDRDKF